MFLLVLFKVCFLNLRATTQSTLKTLDGKGVVEDYLQSRNYYELRKIFKTAGANNIAKYYESANVMESDSKLNKSINKDLFDSGNKTTLHEDPANNNIKPDVCENEWNNNKYFEDFHNYMENRDNPHLLNANMNPKTSLSSPDDSYQTSAQRHKEPCFSEITPITTEVHVVNTFSKTRNEELEKQEVRMTNKNSNISPEIQTTTKTSETMNKITIQHTLSATNFIPRTEPETPISQTTREETTFQEGVESSRKQYSPPLSVTVSSDLIGTGTLILKCSPATTSPERPSEAESVQGMANQTDKRIKIGEFQTTTFMSSTSSLGGILFTHHVSSVGYGDLTKTPWNSLTKRVNKVPNFPKKTTKVPPHMCEEYLKMCRRYPTRSPLCRNIQTQL